jgi:Rap guanine nucleotide exchange factor 2
MDKLYHRGVMRTKCDDCQFVCITQTDYFSILHKGEENTRRHEENGRVVLVTEQRAQIGAASSSQRSHIVIKVSGEHIDSARVGQIAALVEYSRVAFLFLFTT